MAQELLIAGKVEDIKAEIKRYRIPSDEPVYMLLETQPQGVVEPDKRQDLLRFDYFDRDTNFMPYTSGRIFHRGGELRWEKQHAGIRIVYTGQEQYKPDIDIRQTMQMDACELVPKQYFLFGKRLDEKQLARIGSPAQAGDFAEARIPRLLRYPAPADGERVQLVVYEYVERVTGAYVAFRFAELIGAK